MFTLTLTLDSLSIYIVAADIVILLSYVLYLFHKKRELANSLLTISLTRVPRFASVAISLKA
ncbi:MAG TPA: hypothetical protein PLJ70_07420 [Methylotenera sp.]|nr:hypothetical protein [Methylotenera sp.]